ncbi:transcriptional repressor Rhit-like [Euwallacea similis]|uniref:transcriptional repressor Rhit-like n=1 Tax=Euwallacea similis TaxID=1736056 RepID=UPI00344C06D9
MISVVKVTLTKNPLTTMFACPNCNKIYHHKKTLSRHIRQECGIEPELKCPFCPYRARKLNFRHLRRTKTSRTVGAMRRLYEAGYKTLFPCDFCDKLYTEKKILELHYFTAHGDVMKVGNTYLCPCGKTYKCKASLQRHSRNEYYSYQCTDCYRRYKRKKHLLEHQKYECNQVAQLPCPHCLKKFKKTSSLNRHVKMNCSTPPPPLLDEKEPEPKRGVRAESFLNHVRGKNGCLKFVKEKRFRCPVQGCSYLGKKPEHLKLHISNGHRKNWATYFNP